MRRPAPRGLDRALGALLGDLRPATKLARVQENWPEVVGETLAAETEPVSERGGTVTVSCRSAVWAQELQLLSSDLVDRLNEALGPGGAQPPIDALRFVTGGRSSRLSRG